MAGQNSEPQPQQQKHFDNFTGLSKPGYSNSLVGYGKWTPGGLPDKSGGSRRTRLDLKICVLMPIMAITSKMNTLGYLFGLPNVVATSKKEIGH